MDRQTKRVLPDFFYFIKNCINLRYNKMVQKVRGRQNNENKGKACLKDSHRLVVGV